MSQLSNFQASPGLSELPSSDHWGARAQPTGGPGICILTNVTGGSDHTEL